MAAPLALYEELLGRETPLLFMVDPRTRGARLRSLPGGFEALAVYADNASLLTSARDLGLSIGSFAAAEMTPRKLFAWGAGQGWAVARCAFAEPGKPVSIPIQAEEVGRWRRGARGELITTSRWTDRATQPGLADRRTHALRACTLD